MGLRKVAKTSLWLLFLFIAKVELNKDKAQYYQFVGKVARVPCGQLLPDNGVLHFYNTETEDGNHPPPGHRLVSWNYPHSGEVLADGYMYDDQTGELIILQTALKHETTYTCYVFDYKKETFTYSYLHVYVPPMTMSITPVDGDGAVVAPESEPMTSWCTVYNVKPGNITIRWYVEPAGVFLGEGTKDETKNDDTTFDIVGKLSYKYKRGYDGQILTCQATHGVDHLYKGTEQRQLTINYQYLTRVAELDVNEKPIKGHQKQLSCLIKSEGKPNSTETEWLQDGHVISPSGTKYVGLNDTKLTIRALGIHDEGIYTCRRANAAGLGAIGGEFNMDVYRGPTGAPTVVPSDITTSVGSNVHLVCNVESLKDGGKPLATVFTWEKDGNFIKSGRENFHDVKPHLVTDSATYTCSVKNNYGHSLTSHKSLVEVEAPVRLERQDTNLIYRPEVTNKDFFIEFVTSGSDVRSSQMTKAGVVMGPDDFHSERTVIDGAFFYGQTTAHREELQWRLDKKDMDSCESVGVYNGDYTYTVHGMSGGEASQDETMFSIDVLYAPMKGSGPWIYKSPLYGHLILSLDICSNPDPDHYEWYHREGDLPLGVEARGRILDIKDIQKHHYGTYFCNVTNTINGMKHTRNFSVKLIETDSSSVIPSWVIAVTTMTILMVAVGLMLLILVKYKVIKSRRTGNTSSQDTSQILGGSLQGSSLQVNVINTPQNSPNIGTTTQNDPVSVNNSNRGYQNLGYVSSDSSSTSTDWSEDGDSASQSSVATGDILTGRNETNGRRYKAIYRYAATGDGELAFVQDDEFIIDGPAVNGWFTGQLLSTNETGWIPAAYVQEL